MVAVAPVAPDRFPERGALPRLALPSPWSGSFGSTWRATGRAVSFSVRSLNGERAHAIHERSLPAAPPAPWAFMYAALDEFVKVYFEFGRTGGFDELGFERIEAEVEGLIEHHDHRGVTDDPFSHHDDPPAPTQFQIVPRRFRGIDGEWMTFESGWEPHPAAPGCQRWIDDVENRVVHVALLRHERGPRPWVFLLHGAEMGRADIDARALRANRLHRSLGVNIAMPVLPKHGPRGKGDRAIRGTFPSLEMAENIHGVSQAIWDVRRVLTWVRTQDPAAIGVFGFSLGAHVASLLASLEPKLNALVLGCPVVDLVDLFVTNTPTARDGAERLAILYERSRLAHRPVSPLHLRRVLDKDRIVLFGAPADRLSDPVYQLSRLWDHWDRPELQWTNGGHVSYFMQKEPVQLLEAALRERNVVA